MGYKDPTYVIFDGDNDRWAYAFMKGWKANDHIDFDFRDAHELDSMTGRAQNEAYVKTYLRERMTQSAAVVALIGEKTKNLYKYVRWELELAISLDLPIIAANLNKKNGKDEALCPAIIRDAGGRVVHIPFSLSAIQFSLDNFPSTFRNQTPNEKATASWYYTKFDNM